jgi:hypothetical protein
MSVRQMTAAELEPEFKDALTGSIRMYPDAIGIVVYQNADLSSRYIGQQTGCPFGPSNTIKSLEHVEELKTLPFQPHCGSAWQYYPHGWIPRAEFE